MAFLDGREKDRQEYVENTYQYTLPQKHHNYAEHI